MTNPNKATRERTNLEAWSCKRGRDTKMDRCEERNTGPDRAMNGLHSILLRTAVFVGVHASVLTVVIALA